MLRSGHGSECVQNVTYLPEAVSVFKDRLTLYFLISMVVLTFINIKKKEKLGQ